MVGFRYFVLGHAERLGLTGWVRNGNDGQTVGAQPALGKCTSDLARGSLRPRVSGKLGPFSPGLGRARSRLLYAGRAGPRPCESTDLESC